MRRILVVDDEPKILRLIGGLLEESGYATERCERGEAARTMLENEIFDLMITDVRLPDTSGVDLLEFARQVNPGIQVILITAYGTVSEGVRAMKAGAFDYILKPFEMDALRLLVERALGQTDLRERLHVLGMDDRRRRGQRKLVGSGPAMTGVHELIDAVAPAPTTVLIQGESGTGKEMVAETVHAQSLVADRPLVRVNCLAIPSELIESELFGHVKGAFTGATESRKGMFELADRGTLFLDEVADLPLDLQGKFLRALEEQRIVRVGSGRETAVDVRVLVASNVDLKERVAAGHFRDDLYYRLSVFPIQLPPLRERLEDIADLSACLLDEVAFRLARTVVPLEDAALEALEAYRWPGNVRELRNVLERAAVLAGSGPIGLKHLPAELFGPPGAFPDESGGFNGQVEHFKSQLVLEALRQCNWVKKEAAERLVLSPRALSHYVSKYDLDSYRSED